MMNNPQRIIIHHSLTKDSGTVSWGAIHRYHTQMLGWSDIGYHFGIERVQDKIQVLMGRMPDRQGAHTRGHNINSIGICFVGNYDKVQVPQDMWEKGIQLVRYLKRVYNISEVKGHNEYSYKSCPGKNFDMERFRRECL